tara:strand:+ start:411 stop:905 length:495 start_codon:yes stop_codon:yes gene_type:complete
MIDVTTIIVMLILIYIVYNFMHGSDNKYTENSNNAVVPKREITDLEKELRQQYENSKNENNDSKNDGNNTNNNDNNNDGNNTNNNDSTKYDNLNKDIIDEKNNIVFGVIDKTVDAGKESLPENIQNVKMVQENKKSNIMMDKNMPYIDLENDIINVSLLPELRT